MRNKGWVLSLLLVMGTMVLVPVASADHGLQDGSVVAPRSTIVISDAGRETEVTWAGQSEDFLLFQNEALHDLSSYEVTTRDWHVEIRMSLSFLEDSDGSGRLVPRFEGDVWPCGFPETLTVDTTETLSSAHSGRVNIEVSCLIDGAVLDVDGFNTLLIRPVTSSGSPATIDFLNWDVTVTQIDYEVLDMPTAFEATTGFTGAEFAFIVAAAVAGIIVWSRSKDVIVQVFAGFIVATVGLAMLFTVFEAGPGSLWIGAVSIPVVVSLVGVYLVIRTAWEASEGEMMGS